jgi:hypothetical protein
MPTPTSADAFRRAMGFAPAVEPAKISDCPYRPGTAEHSQWIKDNVLAQQPGSQAYQQHKADVDKQIAARHDALHNTVSARKAAALDALIADLPGNEPKDEPMGITDLIRYYGNLLAGAKPHSGKFTSLDPIPRVITKAIIEEVNATWARTGLGIEDDKYVFMPSVDQAPDWVKAETLYKMLNQLCNTTLDSRTLYSGMVYMPVMQRQPYSFKALLDPDPAALTIEQVSFRLRAHMRH